MAITLTWAEDSSGANKTTIDLDKSPNGSQTTEKTIYISHNGLAAITNLKLFVVAREATYSGDGTGAEDDRAELIAWADATTSNKFGGVQISMDNGVTWPTFGLKTATNNLAFTSRTGVADTAKNGILLKKQSVAGGTIDGTIPTGLKAKLKVRIVVPNSENTLGTRQIDLTATFDSTI